MPVQKEGEEGEAQDSMPWPG